MGLLNKIFRPEPKGGDTASVPPSATRFQVTDSGTEDEKAEARQAVRRELVQVTLRETMRRHAVPSDWMEVRMLPVVTSKGKSGMHVQLVVKQGQGSLLGYIPAFQSGFMAEIEKFEPRAWDWLFSISWQFAAITASNGGEEAAGSWQAASPVTAPAPARPERQVEDDDVAQDLKALFAIRDAAMKPRADDTPPDFEPTRPFNNSQGGAGR
ncbi:hypothetical protein [Ramlibacter sp. Leaf400]|uniref:hypothetical protein n=1 Tax=Ramlibacter sp. Leaf400 TaxID=1736365 RepID=UPI0006FA0ABB|nr:hypothetical protein [Ramlibacter sp. Leaf400]KQT07608.1 hypothetical protein ASG30_17400 [Ramlibacter sp. Leaf400]